MLKALIAATSLLVVGGGFGAALGSLPARADTVAPSRPHAVVSSSGKTRWVYKHANDCAPWQAVAVWAPGPQQPAPIGYRCYQNSNGG